MNYYSSLQLFARSVYNVYQVCGYIFVDSDWCYILRYSASAKSGYKKDDFDNEICHTNPDFESILKQYHKNIYNLIYRMLNNPDEASDITQEAFINAYRGYNRFKGAPSAIYPWLCKIAVNACVNRFREINRRNRFEIYSIDEPINPYISEDSHEIPDESTNPAVIIQSKATEEMIQEAINDLPPAHRIVVLLRDMEGLSYKEIADATGYSLDQVKVRLYRAREALRKRLSAYIRE